MIEGPAKSKALKFFYHVEVLINDKVFVDTDIIYDVVANFEPSYLYAAQLFTLAYEE